MLNDHFVQAEVEYLRQQRLAAASDHRRAKSAAKVHAFRSRVAAAVEHLVPGRSHRDRTAQAA